MNKRQLAICIFFLTALLSVVVLAACGPSTSASNSSGTPASSNINAAALMQTQCTRCHSIDRITSKTKDAAQWKVTVDRMIAHGAQISPSEEQALVDYLAQTY